MCTSFMCENIIKLIIFVCVICEFKYADAEESKVSIRGFPILYKANDVPKVNSTGKTRGIRAVTLTALHNYDYEDGGPIFIEEPPPFKLTTTTTTTTTTTKKPSTSVAPTHTISYSETSQPYVEWVPTTRNEAHKLAKRAVEVGREGGVTGGPLWAIRTVINDELTPGKFVLRYTGAFVAQGEREYGVNEFEVLCMSRKHIGWAKMKKGEVHPDGVIGGRTVAGEPIYVGRVNEFGILTPGKVAPSYKVLYTSYGGKALPYEEYEVLYVNKLKDQPYTEWVATNRQDAHKLAGRALEIGQEDAGIGGPLWAIRAPIKGDMTPGKFVLRFKGAYVAYGGQEHFVQNFEVLCMDRKNAGWAKMKDGEIPLDAVMAGPAVNENEWIFVGRVKEYGIYTPGKVYPLHKVMYTSYGGKELSYGEYEVLYINTLENQRHVDWVSTTRRDAHKLTGRAAEVGSEGGGAAWAIRATINGELTPGKFLTATNQAAIPKAGQVYTPEEFEVLCMSNVNIGWVKSKNGAVHSDSVIGGRTATGEYTFIGRVTLADAVVPGKVANSYGGIHVAANGKDEKYTEYEIMYITYS